MVEVGPNIASFGPRARLSLGTFFSFGERSYWIVAMAWDRLREDMIFKSMKEKIMRHRRSVSWRQTLSAHMTKSCGFKHKAPIPSLKSCGFDNLNAISGQIPVGH